MRVIAIPTSILLLILIQSPGLAQDISGAQSPYFQKTLDSITVLEGKRDPKCYATATRLEDFICGTPLSNEARLLKIDLEKELIRQIWTEADQLAREAGQTSIDRQLLLGVLDSIWEDMAVTDESWHITTLKGDRIQLSKRDVRQYASVAFSLRAVLAFQQDQLIFSDTTLLSLDEDAHATLIQFLDLFNVAALQTADRLARGADVYSVSATALSGSWKSVKGSGFGSDQSPQRAARNEPVSSSEPFTLTRTVIRNKIASYEAYNNISLPVFMRNIQVYFARHRWPTDEDASNALKSLYTEIMINFSMRLLSDSETVARKNGHPLVRVEDVQLASQRLVPHTTNHFEDVSFFPRLAKDKRILIESFDLDAFRDGGLHWQYIQAALDDPAFDGKLEPDPFALELLAENIAQFGVLFLRVSGQNVEGSIDEPLAKQHFNQATEVILSRLREHEDTEEESSQQMALASAPSHDVLPSNSAPFTNITDKTGLQFVHRSSDWLNRFIRSYSVREETVAVLAIPPAFGGSGAASEDLNDDGYPDLLLLSGSGNKLYLNKGNGEFQDVTEASGIDWRRPDGLAGEPRQPLIADLDNDGLQDIVITYVNDAHRIYRNTGNAQFEDVTAQAGLGGEGLVGGPATVVDIDNDGLLDLYVAYFGQYIDGILPTLSRRNVNGLPNRLFKNLGNFEFEDITEGSGVAGSGWTQATGHTDFNLDGLQDLIEGNDFGINAYYENQGDGTFVNVAESLNTDKPSYTMSIGISDLNQDRYPDIYISNIVTMDKDQKYVNPAGETAMKFDSTTLAHMRVVEANDLWVSTHKDGTFSGYEQSTAIGRGKTSTGWAWGADFFDFDNDGDDDLYVANGMNEFAVYSAENPYYQDPTGQERDVQFPESAPERNVLFRNDSGKLLNDSEHSGADLYGNSRAVVYFDFDKDGDLDLALNNYHEPAVVLRNNSESNENNWIKIRLVGDPEQGVNRDAIGAKLLLTTEDSQTVWREVHGGNGYLTMNPKQQHFGIGSSKTATVEVTWPNNTVRKLSGLRANTSYRLDLGTNKLTEIP